MTRSPKVLAFAGSLREHALSKRVLQIAIKGAEKAGAEVTYVDLRDYPMPIYNLDEHEKTGFDEKALAFQGLLVQHDGFLIASPEYNGSLPAALKKRHRLGFPPQRQVSEKRCVFRKVRRHDVVFPGLFGRRALLVSSSRRSHQYQRQCPAPGDRGAVCRREVCRQR